MENVPAHMQIHPVGGYPRGSLIWYVLLQCEYSRSNHFFPLVHFTKHLVIQYLDFEPQNKTKQTDEWGWKGVGEYERF